MTDTTVKTKKQFKLTGWHFLGIMVSFFAVIVIVNMVFVTRALNAFSGLVVKNSYIASQEYNEKIEQSEKQKLLGWDLDLLVDANGADFVLKDKAGEPVTKKLITLQLRMVKNEKADMSLLLKETAAGQYTANFDGKLKDGLTIPPNGAWLITIDILQNGVLDYHYEETRDLTFNK